jgi:hypothetical protein
LTIQDPILFIYLFYQETNIYNQVFNDRSLAIFSCLLKSFIIYHVTLAFNFFFFFIYIKKREREGSTLHPTTRNASNTNYRCKCGVILPPNKEGDLCDYPYLLKVVHAATPAHYSRSHPPIEGGDGVVVGVMEPCTLQLVFVGFIYYYF